MFTNFFIASKFFQHQILKKLQLQLLLLDKEDRIGNTLKAWKFTNFRECLSLLIYLILIPGSSQTTLSNSERNKTLVHIFNDKTIFNSLYLDHSTIQNWQKYPHPHLLLQFPYHRYEFVFGFWIKMLPLSLVRILQKYRHSKFPVLGGMP